MLLSKSLKLQVAHKIILNKDDDVRYIHCVDILILRAVILFMATMFVAGAVLTDHTSRGQSLGYTATFAAVGR